MMTATPLDAFRQAIEMAGLTPPVPIVADGKLHRFASNGFAPFLLVPSQTASWL